MDAWVRYLRALDRRERARARARKHAEKRRKTPAKRPATVGGEYIGKAAQPFTTDDPLYIKYFGSASLPETLRALREAREARQARETPPTRRRPGGHKRRRMSLDDARACDGREDNRECDREDA